MKLVVSPLAVRRLIAIADHIAADRPAAAGRVEAAIRDAFALLASHPYCWAQRPPEPSPLQGAAASLCHPLPG